MSKKSVKSFQRFRSGELNLYPHISANCLRTLCSHEGSEVAHASSIDTECSESKGEEESQKKVLGEKRQVTLLLCT